jgi:HEPN domain-containing protein
MNKTEHIIYWINSADHDLESAESLYTAGRYDWCLFISHIVIEKILKAAYVLSHDNDTPPKIHNLLRLSELTGLKFSDEQIELLDRLNDFNIEARYPDYKFSFYRTCTYEFTTEYFKKAKDLFTWIKSRIISDL